MPGMRGRISVAARTVGPFATGPAVGVPATARRRASDSVAARRGRDGTGIGNPAAAHPSSRSLVLSTVVPLFLVEHLFYTDGPCWPAPDRRTRGDHPLRRASRAHQFLVPRWGLGTGRPG